MEQKLEIDVHAHWNSNPPIYRLFVDNEMLTERTFGHVSYQFFITEHMYCHLETGVHVLILENLDEQSSFKLDNFFVNKIMVGKNLMQIKDNGKIEWKFVIDNLLKRTDNVQIQEEQILLASVPDRPKKIIQTKNYETYIPLVQRARELNAKK